MPRKMPPPTSYKIRTMIEISSEYPALVRSRIDEDRFWIWVPQNEKENAGLVGGFNHLEKYESQWDG